MISIGDLVSLSLVLIFLMLWVIGSYVLFYSIIRQFFKEEGRIKVLALLFAVLSLVICLVLLYILFNNFQSADTIYEI